MNIDMRGLHWVVVTSQTLPTHVLHVSRQE